MPLAFEVWLSKPLLQGLLPAVAVFLTSKALSLAYLQDLLVADYCSTRRLAVSRILLYWLV